VVSEANTGERTRLLRRLQADVERLRLELAAVQEESRQIAALEAQGHLSDEVKARAARLRREGERLRWQLLGLRKEFDQLRRRPPGEGG
jgi:hypothetical protein